MLNRLLWALFLIVSFSGISRAESCLTSPELPKSSISITEPRIALVIGNSDYKNLNTTPNAKNDARDIAVALQKLGFEVLCGVNLTRDKMINLVNLFQTRLNDMGSRAVSIFYYAGHGTQINATNYMIPLGANFDNSDEFDNQAVNLDYILGVLADASNEKGSRFIVLDACRDNPLGKGWGKPKAQFSIKGLYWVFGTGYGQYAADGDDTNGLFTKHLLQNMFTKGATFEQILKKVTAAVDYASNGNQVPEVGGSLVRDFMFIPGRRVTIETIYEETPLWEKSLYWVALLLLLITSYGFYAYRKATAWTRGVDLTDKLIIDPKVAEEVREKSHLATDDIVGYVKDVKNKKLLALVTPKYDLVMGRNNNVNVVLSNDSVSGEHAQLGWDKKKKQFWLEDLNSTNGTWFGKGKQISRGKRVSLKSGQIFYLADQNTPIVVIAHVSGK